MSAVVIEDLHVRLGGADILNHLALDVAEGEFLVLLGPSGCGKSTLLHSIAGLLDVHDGRIAIGGRDVTYADPKDRGIGMVFQSYALYPTMTVERNMSFGLRVSGTPRAEIERRVGTAARMLQLTELLQRKPSQLSGGQRQRVAIGRALVRDAAVYLFDEPLSNLDAQLRAELRRELKLLHKNIAKTMIYVTHDQVEAMTLATRIVIMRGGKMLQIDTPQRIYDEPANLFVAGFIGSPPMNFVRGTLEGSDAGMRFVSPALTVALAAYPFARPPLPGTEVVLGVRPEHLSLCEPAQAQGRAKVSLVEPMGAKQLVWLDLLSQERAAPELTQPPWGAHAGSAVAIELDAQATTELHDEVCLAVDPKRVSVFDAGTEQRA